MGDVRGGRAGFHKPQFLLLLGYHVSEQENSLKCRRQACKQINDMCGLELWCDYREDYQAIELIADDTVNGEPNSDGEGGDVDE